jgi:hypothetical protein
MKVSLVFVLIFSIVLFSCESSASSTEKDTIQNKENISDTSFFVGSPYNGLNLSIRFIQDSLEMKITNVSDSIIKVCSHINFSDLDWYSINLEDQNGDKRTMHIGEMVRTGSQMHTQTLNSLESFSHVKSLKFWAQQEVNSNEKLTPGIYKVSVNYEADNCYYPSTDFWNGKIQAGPIDCLIK